MTRNLTESAVIGGLFLEPERPPLIAECSEHFFKNPLFKEAFLAIAKCEEEGVIVDPLTVTHQAKKNGTDIDPQLLLDTLFSVVAESAKEHTRAHIRILREEHARETAARQFRDLAEKAVEPTQALEESLDEAVTFSTELRRSSSPGRKARTLADGLSTFLMHLDEPAHDGVRGLETGFPGLDAAIDGLQGGCLYILAARPGLGKSALALNIATHNWIHAEVDGLFFSLEMQEGEILSRLVSGETSVPLSKISSRRLGEEDRAAIAGWTEVAGPRLTHSGGLLCSPSLSPTLLRSEIVAFSERGTPKFVVVDYLQLMTAGEGRSREEEVAKVSRSLKALALEFNIPVLALSQINRGAESRADKRPVLSDLRESGAIEQDADVVMFLYREGMGSETELIIAKNRQGPLCSVPLLFHGETTSFSSLP